MKYALVPLALFSLAACTTTANRREMWSPAKGHGPYTDKLRNMTLSGRSDHRSQTFTVPVTKQAGGQPPAGATPAPAPNAAAPSSSTGAPPAPAPPLP